MKTATMPSIRVEPELREAAEAVLKEGETLSGLMEDALRRSIERRRVRSEFLERGLKSLAEVRAGGKTYPAEVVLAELEDIIRKAAQKKAAQEKA